MWEGPWSSSMAAVVCDGGCRKKVFQPYSQSSMGGRKGVIIVDGNRGNGW